MRVDNDDEDSFSLTEPSYDLTRCSLPFQLATKVTTFFIEHFGMRDLFGRENYEYYARLTGRILKVGSRSPPSPHLTCIPHDCSPLIPLHPRAYLTTARSPHSRTLVSLEILSFAG